MGSGVVLPDQIHDLCLNSICYIVAADTPDAYHASLYPFLPSDEWKPETAPLFAFGAPKAKRITAKLLALQAATHTFTDGSKGVDEMTAKSPFVSRSISSVIRI